MNNQKSSQKTRVQTLFADGKTVAEIARQTRIPAQDVAKLVRSKINRLTPAMTAKRKALTKLAPPRPTDQRMPPW